MKKNLLIFCHMSTFWGYFLVMPVCVHIPSSCDHCTVQLKIDIKLKFDMLWPIYMVYNCIVFWTNAINWKWHVMAPPGLKFRLLPKVYVKLKFGIQWRTFITRNCSILLQNRSTGSGTLPPKKLLQRKQKDNQVEI